MASLIYDSEFDESEWLRPTANPPYASEFSLVYPYPCPPDLYVNKVWDNVAGAYVRWSTFFMDRQGSVYPGPAAWSAVAATYCVESITFQRLE